LASQRANSNFFAAAGTKLAIQQKKFRIKLHSHKKGKVFYCVTLFAIFNAHTHSIKVSLSSEASFKVSSHLTVSAFSLEKKGKKQEYT